MTLVNFPGLARIYIYIYMYIRVYIAVLAVLLLYRLSALYPAWFYFDLRHFLVACQVLHWFNNPVVYFIINVHISWQRAPQIVNWSIFSIFLYWRAHCTAIQVQADEQLWSSWRWLWNHNCHKLVELDTYLLVFSSLLCQFCYDRKSQPLCLAPSLFYLATYLGWTACHQSGIWYEYRHLKPEDHLKMEKNKVNKVGTSPQPSFTLSLADTVQKPLNNFWSLHACHHGVVVPLVWTLVGSQTLSWFSSHHDWLVRST